jgi:membrane associated rhomboid family serine protease
MPQTFASIPARSRQQALEWSLVLVSQGIETTIEQAEDGSDWRLIVNGSDSQRALQTLRQYKIENRTRTWQHSLPTGLIFDWRSLAWLLVLIACFWVQTRNPSLTLAGRMDRQAVWSGQWWRLFTAVTLHRDLSHLASNLSVGTLLLGLAMGSFGSGSALLAAYLAGVAGNVAALFFYAGNHLSLGASGMVFGALGLLSGQMFGSLTRGLTNRQLTIRAVLSGFLLLVLFGLNPESDVIAHAGGFCAGVLFGALLTLWPNRLAQSASVNLAAGLVCAVIVLLSWWRALVRS